MLLFPWAKQGSEAAPRGGPEWQFSKRLSRALVGVLGVTGICIFPLPEEGVVVTTPRSRSTTKSLQLSSSAQAAGLFQGWGLCPCTGEKFAP